MQQFDPNIPGLIEGEVKTFIVTDPASTVPPFEVGNHVLDPSESFELSVSWSITGLLRPLWLAALGGRWNVQVFAESVGAGEELLLASDDSVAADPTVFDYALRFTVPGGTLVDGAPGRHLYKLVVAVFLSSDLGEPGFDMTGFQEGPIIQVQGAP
jgi:hypothetical protein